MADAEVPKALPNHYNVEKVEEVIEKLHEGETLTSICKDDEIPFTIGTFLKWVREDHQNLSQRYARARQIGWEVMADEIIDISDDSSRDTKLAGEDDKAVCDTEWVQRTKIRADNRKWIISKRVPDYSDQKQGNSGTAETIAAALLALSGNLPD